VLRVTGGFVVQNDDTLAGAGVESALLQLLAARFELRAEVAKAGVCIGSSIGAGRAIVRLGIACLDVGKSRSVARASVGLACVLRQAAIGGLDAPV